MKEGKITKCPHQGCNFTCCDFNQNNYIVLYPGEYEQASEKGHSVAHLDITDDNYFGGKKAICKAKERKTCDTGYKPLDCQSYPLFPVIEDEEIGFIRGSKCPLATDDLDHHADFVKNEWQKLTDKNEVIKTWLSKIRLVGYEKLKVKA